MAPYFTRRPALLFFFGACALLCRAADVSPADPAGPPPAKFTYTESLKRIKTIRDNTDARINAEKNRLLSKLKSEAVSRLVVLRDRFTHDDKVDEAFAVKALCDDPDSAISRGKAPEDTKPVLADYDAKKATVVTEATAASTKLANEFYEALKGEMKSAMTRGDFDTASGLKLIIESRGNLPGAPVASSKSDAKSPGPAELIGVSYGCVFPKGVYFWEFQSATQLIEWKQGRSIRTVLQVEPDGKGAYIISKPTLKWHLRIVGREALIRTDMDGGAKWVYKPMKDDSPAPKPDSPTTKKEDPDDTPFGKRVKSD